MADESKPNKPTIPVILYRSAGKSRKQTKTKNLLGESQQDAAGSGCPTEPRTR